jgi:hypothetical protein
MSQIPIGWLLKKDGFEGLPLEQQVSINGGPPKTS